MAWRCFSREGGGVLGGMIRNAAEDGDNERCVDVTGITR
jgi:hypothetical protein